MPETATTVLAVSNAALRRKLTDDLGFGSRFYHALAVLLAQRLRQTTMSSIGCGVVSPAPAEGNDEDEIDFGMLANVNLAGAKFDKLLKLAMRAA